MDRKWQKDRHSELTFSQGNHEYLSLKNICNIIIKAEERWGSWSGSEQALGGREAGDPLDSAPQAGTHPFIHPFSHSLNPFVLPDDGLSREDIRGTRRTAAWRQLYLDLKNYQLNVILRALKSDSERKGWRWNELKSPA